MSTLDYIPVDPSIQVEYRDLDFLGYPGYQVGDDGSVWSRLVPSGRVYWRLGDTWYELKPCLQKKKIGKEIGRHSVTLCHNGKRVKFRVHKLVLLAFVGPCPEGMEALHGVEGRLCNHLRNLHYGTHAENIADMVRDGTVRRGDNHGTAKLNELAIHKIRLDYRLGWTQEEIATIYRVKREAISKIVRGVRWSHIETFPTIAELQARITELEQQEVLIVA